MQRVILEEQENRKTSIRTKVVDVMERSKLGDFIIVYTSVTLFFLFTGLCMLFNRKIDSRWFDLMLNIKEGETIKKVQKKVNKKPKAKTKVVNV